MLFMVPHSLELVCLFITALPCDFIRMPNAYSNNVCTKVSLTFFLTVFPRTHYSIFCNSVGWYDGYATNSTESSHWP